MVSCLLPRGLSRRLGRLALVTALVVPGLSLGLAAKSSPVDKRLATIQKAIVAYHSGDYERTRSLLTPFADSDQLKDYRSRDYLLFVLGDSEALLAVPCLSTVKI